LERRGDDLAARLLQFGVDVIEVAGVLRGSYPQRHIGMQLVRSGTSAGANYEEARGAESRADFAHKIGIAAKEAREAGYWLRLLQQNRLHPHDLSMLLQECSELIAILVASRRTARAGEHGTNTEVGSRR
jgi:four helix bundle protein